MRLFDNIKIEYRYTDLESNRIANGKVTVDTPTHWRTNPTSPKNDLNENCNLGYRTVDSNSGRRAEA